MGGRWIDRWSFIRSWLLADFGHSNPWRAFLPSLRIVKELLETSS
jgi:hypothetical protein